MRLDHLKNALEKLASPSALVLREGAVPVNAIGSKLLQKLYAIQKQLIGTKILKPEEVPANFNGDVVDLSMRNNPVNTHGDVIAPRSLRGLNSKREEARVLSETIPEFFPRTISNLSKELRQNNIDPSDLESVRRHIEQRLGTNSWIFKPEYGARQNIDMFPKSVEQLLSMKYPKGIIQEYRPIEAKGRLNRIADSLLAKLIPTLHETNVASIGKSKEYRVHVIKGKVVRNGTLLRSSLLGSAFPIETSNTKKVNAFVQKAIDQASERGLGRLKQGFLGVDVGIDTAGKPFIIELNPAQIVRNRGTSDYVGTSGFVDNPLIADAITKAAFGKMPFMQKTEIAGKTGLVGTAGIGTAAYLGSDRNNQKNVV